MAGHRIEFLKGQNRENGSYQERSRKKKFLTVLIKELENCWLRLASKKRVYSFLLMC